MLLTPRQKQFYDALDALCDRKGRSVHYSQVAATLGVSPYSAYDMLQVLKAKGAVAAEYVLEGNPSGPGRSAVCFYPLPLQATMQVECGGDEAEWSNLSQKLLQRLREASDSNVRETLTDLLSRLSDLSTPLSFCTGVVAVLLLNLRLSGSERLNDNHVQALHQLVMAGEIGLATLAGLSLGASLERVSQNPALEPLFQAARRFQGAIAALGNESRQRLSEFLAEALAAIEMSVA